MAAYSELYTLAQTNSELKNKVTVACVVAAEAIRTEADTVPNHANRLLWAKAVFANPAHEGQRMLWAVLAANKAAATNVIISASDSTIQSNVDAAVNIFAMGA